MMLNGYSSNENSSWIQDKIDKENYKRWTKMYDWKYHIVISTPDDGEVFTKHHDVLIKKYLERINFYLLKKMYGGKWWNRRRLTFGKSSFQFIYPDIDENNLRHYHVLWYLPFKDEQILMEYRDLFIKRWKYINRNNTSLKSIMDIKPLSDDETEISFYNERQYPHFSILNQENRKNKIRYCYNKIDAIGIDEIHFASIS